MKSRANAVWGEPGGFGKETVVLRRERRGIALRQRQRGLERRDGVRGGMARWWRLERSWIRNVIFVIDIASVL